MENCMKTTAIILSGLLSIASLTGFTAIANAQTNATQSENVGEVRDNIKDRVENRKERHENVKDRVENRHDRKDNREVRRDRREDRRNPIQHQ